MESINIPKEKFGQVINDFERLISHFEDLVEDQDKIAKQRLNDIKEGSIKGKSEKELDEYLKKRGVKVE